MEDLKQKRSLYPRVSEIISKQNANELRGVSLEVLANACLRGEKVHGYCSAWARNLWITDIEPEYEPYVNAFVEWANENIEEVLYSNIRLYDDELRFTGEFDMMVKMKESKKIYIIDIKTSYNSSKTWPLQLAAYGHLCRINGYQFDSVMNVHLKRFKGKFEEKGILPPTPQIRVCVTKHEDLTPYWCIFSSALRCYDYFDRKEAK